jgi:hypothetical protein
MKLLQKNELAELFQDCVDRVKAMMGKRKLMTRQSGTPHDKRKKSTVEASMDLKITEQELMLADKEKILELFVPNDKVMKILKYIVFYMKDKKDTRTTKEHDTSSLAKAFESESEVSAFTNILNDTRMNFLNMSFNGPTPDVGNFKLPTMIETETPQVRKVTTSETNPMQTQMKFGQLFGSPKVPAFKPKLHTVKHVLNSYKS